MRSSALLNRPGLDGRRGGLPVEYPADCALTKTAHDVPVPVLGMAPVSLREAPLAGVFLTRCRSTGGTSIRRRFTTAKLRSVRGGRRLSAALDASRAALACTFDGRQRVPPRCCPTPGTDSTRTGKSSDSCRLAGQSASASGVPRPSTIRCLRTGAIPVGGVGSDDAGERLAVACARASAFGGRRR